ncbi:MAG TPA: NYN domain-containing protein [Blastocatellia bacterium]|jgi:predicted RNA-binding protein with PIN domain|nr:NYN domain-containing protein [Blastocatellia bacterium]
MAYIVDGNNVMGQTPGWHRDREGARRRLVEELAEFARIKKARVTVVFDGEPDRIMPDSSAYRGVRVLYAERGSDADTRIERLVDSSADRRGITVVTSDRALAALVRGRGACVVRSGEFRRRMREAGPSGPALEDGEEPDIGDLNAWLRYFGAYEGEDDD